ncbi:MAG: hypothetical protein QOK05_644 [Chloroflexota bacterium]|nr:hypothetical protein [Chloroflexota bacterium]
MPDFDDLPILEGLGLRHAWGVFGPDDQLGTINFLTPERVAAAAARVTTGEVISLSLPVDAIDPPFYARQPLAHEVFRLDRNYFDDRLDNFFLQGSTHWDSLRHVQAREFGFWGGVTDSDQLVAGGGPLGIENWVRHGIVGRGVLLDVAGHLASQDPHYDPFVSRSVTVADLEATAARQAVELQEGDVLCLRFGWVGRYRQLDAAGRGKTAASEHDFAGLGAGEDMSRWLWNHRLAAVVADNPAIEVSPGDRNIGSLHRRVLPLLGFALGELFDFEALRAASERDGRWDFMLVSVPLHLVGGVGSPGNAIALR